VNSDFRLVFTISKLSPCFNITHFFLLKVALNSINTNTMLHLLSFDSVHINGPYRPGGPFFEDRSPTTVGYYAKDSSGNMATCNFNIYVNGNVWFRKGRWYQDVIEIIVHQWEVQTCGHNIKNRHQHTIINMKIYKQLMIDNPDPIKNKDMWCTRRVSSSC
jgi:hypothetical protein